MKMIECLHTNNRCFDIKRQNITPVGIVVHSTGVNNPYVKRYSQPSSNDENREKILNALGTNKYGNHWNRSSVSKSVHYFVGRLADKSVGAVKNLPEDIACWGCGKGKNGSYNYSPFGHIQFEICEDDLKNKEYLEECLNCAVELCAGICKRYGWPSSVIVSHKEAHLKGYASNHADIDHWLAKYSLSMDDFRARVDALLLENEDKKLFSVQVGAFNSYENAKSMKERLISDGYDAIIKEI